MRFTDLSRWLNVENLEDRVTPSRMLAYGTDAGVPAAVFVRVDNDNNGTFETLAQQSGSVGNAFFNPFGGFAGGVRVATGDFDGDGSDELVLAAGPGGTPLVVVYKLTASGAVGAFVEGFYAYDPGFSGGVYVAAADVNDDGRAELITGAGYTGGPHVKIYSDTNHDGRVGDNTVDSFYAYAAGFTGGVRVAAGDLNGDGRAEVITGAGPGGSPHVRVLTDTNHNLKVSDDAAISDYYAYDSGFKGGVYVAAGRDSNYVITGAGETGGPHVRIFHPNGLEFDSIYPIYAFTFQGGVRVAAGDAQASPGSPVEVVTVAGPSGSAHTRVFDDNGDAGNRLSDNVTTDDFIANLNLTGYFVAFAKVAGSAPTVPMVPPVPPVTVPPAPTNLTLSATPTATAYGANVNTVTIQGVTPYATVNVSTTAGILTTAAPTAINSNVRFVTVTANATGVALVYLTSPVSFSGATALVTATDKSNNVGGSLTVAQAAAGALRFDFGQATSPAQTGFIAVAGAVIADTQTGIGWNANTPVVDRKSNLGSPNASLIRDLAWNYSGSAGTRTFSVFVGANQAYVARLYIGDSFQNYTGINIANDNGLGVNTQTLTAAQTAKNVFTPVSITGNAGADGFADITFNSTGNYWVVDGLDIALTAANLPTSVI